MNVNPFFFKFRHWPNVMIFDLNVLLALFTDQAEVAAAKLQKQIEQGRLEIASSETTPGSVS